MPKITIGGLAGTGTSTCGELLAQGLGCPYVYGGNFFRSIAKERGVSTEELSRIAKVDNSVDREVDRRIFEFDRINPDYVEDSRLGFYYHPHSIRFYLVCRLETRIIRVMKREGKSYQETLKLTLGREKDDLERFRQNYGIENYNDPRHYSCPPIDTSDRKPEDIVADMIRILKGKYSVR